MQMRLIYVVTWRYSDGSASGAVNAHNTEAEAKRMVSLLAEHGDTMKTFKVEPVPYQEE